jgi:hypothetical protein
MFCCIWPRVVREEAVRSQEVYSAQERQRWANGFQSLVDEVARSVNVFSRDLHPSAAQILGLVSLHGADLLQREEYILYILLCYEELRLEGNLGFCEADYQACKIGSFLYEYCRVYNL